MARSRPGGTATRTEDWDKADGLLALGGVGDIGDRPFGVISEGERQQVLLARALMSDPELLLLDEPFAGLDLGARERLLVRLTALAARPGEPADRPRHAPLRGDPAGVHPRRAGVAAAHSWRRARLPDVVTSEARLGLLRRGGDGRLHRRAVVEPRRLTRGRRPMNRASKEGLDSARR